MKVFHLFLFIPCIILSWVFDDESTLPFLHVIAAAATLSNFHFSIGCPPPFLLLSPTLNDADENDDDDDNAAAIVIRLSSSQLCQFDGL